MGRKNTDGTYTATNIVIPEQVVSSVKTEFTEEGLNSLFKFTSENKCQMVGYIHTHPDYDSSPSSIDLHNMAEWINDFPPFLSIIVSIKENNYKVWSQY